MTVNKGPTWYMEPIVCEKCAHKSKQILDSPGSWGPGHGDLEVRVIDHTCKACNHKFQIKVPKGTRTICRNMASQGSETPVTEPCKCPNSESTTAIESPTQVNSGGYKAIPDTQYKDSSVIDNYFKRREEEEKRKVGLHMDEGKIRMDLNPPIAEEGMAEAFTWGSTKYEDWNWVHGIKYSRLYGSVRRHLSSWYNGEDLDKESELNHLKHVLADVAMLLTYHESGEYDEFDDRYDN